MKNIRLYNAFMLLSIFFLTLTSCEDQGYDEWEEETLPTVSMNGEWMIEIAEESGEVLGSHLVHKMYEVNGQLWISDRIGSSDNFTGWWLEVPLDANFNNLTFSATDELNTADESIVTITNGKILKNAATTPSGVVTDSIYFEAVFDYEPARVLKFAGYKRTGFEEDE